MKNKEIVIEPYTKKCTVGVYNKVLKVNPRAKKTTTWDQAWMVLANAYNLEGSMDSGRDKSRFILYKDNEAIHEFKWDKPIWNLKECDFEWNSIYKEVLEYCISKRLLTTKKKKLKEKENIEDIEDIDIENLNEVKPSDNHSNASQSVSIEVLRKNLNRLSVRKSDWKKIGKDTSELVEEMNYIRSQIKKAKEESE